MRAGVRSQVLLIAAFAAAYAIATAFAQNSYYQLIMTVVPVWGVMGLAWNLLSGYSGFVSFGHAAFFGLGAYFVALAQIKWGLSPWIGIPCAGVVGALRNPVLQRTPTFVLPAMALAAGFCLPLATRWLVRPFPLVGALGCAIAGVLGVVLLRWQPGRIKSLWIGLAAVALGVAGGWLWR